ncbi:ABC transporter ATP-binding protein [Blautia luti]|uniref:ABC transporter ATP-binding protein n=1 Tax=Blautia luti TaxID=89014 RepID=UPI003D78E89D
MMNILRDIWIRDRRGFVMILLLSIAVSLTGGISIVMLVPMLGLLEVSTGSVSALKLLMLPLQSLSPVAQITVMIGIYFILIVLKAYLGWLLKIRQSEFLEEYSLNLRQELYHTVSTARWEQLTAGKQTDTIDLFTAQCSQVSQGVSMIIALLSSVVTAFVSLGIALWLSLPVTVFVLFFGCGFAWVFRHLMKESKRYGDEMIRINRVMYSELYSQLRSIKEVRSYGVQKEHADFFEEISRSSKAAKLRFMRQQAFPSMLYSIAAAGMIAVIFLICVLLFHMDTARLMVLVYVFTRLWPVFSGFINKIAAIQTTIPAYEKLMEALGTLSVEKSGQVQTAPIPFEKEIEFRNVCFAYQGSGESVLHNVNFTLKKGSITALMGRSGAGKTTIADLLMGFLEPTSGEILIDGIKLSDENLPGWRHNLGYIPQEPLILNATVRENLQRFHPAATQAEMEKALKKAYIWDVVENLPQGIDTVLGDGGIRLSGGERQRIVLARVLLGNPRLIVMDEATSAMDYESEMAVRNAIRDLNEQVTILIIAHRLATVRTAKYGLVLENGKITEDGTLRELASHPEGYFNRLLYID